MERDHLEDRGVGGRWEFDMKMDLQVMGCGGVYWIDLAQDRDRWRVIVNVMNFRVN